MINWQELTSTDDLNKLIQASHEQPAIIFKHSTRCNVSAMALNRLERSWVESELPQVGVFFLDLIRHRDISNEIQRVFEVRHESPQALIILGGKCIYNASHLGISYNEIKKFVEGTALVS